MPLYGYFETDEPPLRAPPRRIVDWRNWYLSEGGLDACLSAFEVTLQAVRSATVTVGLPRVHGESFVVEHGIVVHPGELGGANVHPRYYEVDLDAQEGSEVRYLDPSGQPGSARFTMKRGDTEVLLVVARARRNFGYRWTLELPLLVDGRARTIEVNNGGNAFVTIGAENLKSWWHAYDVSPSDGESGGQWFEG